VTNESLCAFLSDRKYRVKAAHRIPDLGAGNPRIPLRHPQSPVVGPNGKTTAFEDFKTGKGDKRISDDMPNDQSSGTVGGPVSSGNLEIEGFGPPPQTNGHCELLADL
jgi:hypothetical protein